MPATALALAAAVLWRWPAWAEWTGAWALAGQIVIPGLALLAAYRASGAFFVAPHRALERRLLALDDAALARSGIFAAYRRAPGLVREAFEVMYLLVYVMLPLGAAALVIGGHAGDLPRFWALVFAAELACYAMLPWVQTRPPRAVEPPATSAAGPMRRLNLAVLARASIQVNTVPSAHAGGAVAVALGVGAALPVVGAVFLALAVGIVLATVLGRYHYLADSALGVGVALAVWALLGVQAVPPV
jgi:hypothetical protein